MCGNTQITHVARAEWLGGTTLKGFNAADDMILYVTASCVSAIFIQQQKEE